MNARRAAHLRTAARVLGRRARAGAKPRREETHEESVLALEILPCGAVREAVSARFDGEDAWLGATAIERHLRRCGQCRNFQAALPHLQEHFAPLVAEQREARLAEAPRGARRWGTSLGDALQWVAVVVPLGIGVASLAGFDLTHAHLVAHHVEKHCMEHLPALLVHRS